MRLRVDPRVRGRAPIARSMRWVFSIMFVVLLMKFYAYPGEPFGHLAFSPECPGPGCPDLLPRCPPNCEEEPQSLDPPGGDLLLTNRIDWSIVLDAGSLFLSAIGIAITSLFAWRANRLAREQHEWARADRAALQRSEPLATSAANPATHLPPKLPPDA